MTTSTRKKSTKDYFVELFESYLTLDSKKSIQIEFERKVTDIKEGWTGEIEIEEQTATMNLPTGRKMIFTFSVFIRVKRGRMYPGSYYEPDFYESDEIESIEVYVDESVSMGDDTIQCDSMTSGFVNEIIKYKIERINL